MGVYIKGIETPKTCVQCKFRAYDPHRDPSDGLGKGTNVCWFTQEEIWNTQRGEQCPLIPVPPHGDLIERKAICLTDFEIAMCGGDYKEGMKMLLEKTESAPTIIPAEEDTDFYTKGHLHLGYAGEGE